MKQANIVKRLSQFVLNFAAIALLAPGVRAETRTSADYSLTTEVLDIGGQRIGGGVYSADSSIGTIGGLSTVSTPPETLKSGYIGQLYDPIGLSIGASPINVNEGTTRQLAAAQTMDDGTFQMLAPSSVSWGVFSGPVSSVSPGGLATAGTSAPN